MSPGQRARIALARALYSQASVSRCPCRRIRYLTCLQCLLLDDPLAAVDMHTAQQLAGALSGPIASGRTIILVTHHISLCLPITAYLVELSQGKVLQHGSIQDLRDRGLLDQVIEKEDVAAEEPADLPNISDHVEVDNTEPAKGKLVEVEARAEGRISFRTYATYIRASGFFTWFATLFLMILIRLINVSNQVRLAQCYFVVY